MRDKQKTMNERITEFVNTLPLDTQHELKALAVEASYVLNKGKKTGCDAVDSLTTDDKKIVRDFYKLNLPDNLLAYAHAHYSTLTIDICNTDAEGGYGHRKTWQIVLLRPYRECIHCEYHSLFNPNDEGSKCGKHTLLRGYAEVFSWRSDCGCSLEAAFDDFLRHQPYDVWGTVIRCGY